MSFDVWPEYRQVLGGWWEWGHSGHAPLQAHRVHVRTGAHPVVADIGDFTIHDELYIRPRLSGLVSALITGDWEGESHPLLWLREYGAARVCYSALGHGPEAFGHDVYRLVLQRAALWLLRGSALLLVSAVASTVSALASG